MFAQYVTFANSLNRFNGSLQGTNRVVGSNEPLVLSFFLTSCNTIYFSSITTDNGSSFAFLWKTGRGAEYSSSEGGGSARVT